MLPETVPLNDLAELLALSPRWVQQLAKRGIVPRAERGVYELVPVVQAYVRWLRDRPERGSDRERHLKAKADLLELELARRRGEMVPLPMVQERLERVLGSMAATLNAAPSRYGPILSPGNPKRGQEILEQVVGEMRGQLRRLPLTEDEAAA
jgi:phage terminase Nu1 subunit (DNA packaging protein)